MGIVKKNICINNTLCFACIRNLPEPAKNIPGEFDREPADLLC